MHQTQSCHRSCSKGPSQSAPKDQRVANGILERIKGLCIHKKCLAPSKGPLSWNTHYLWTFIENLFEGPGVDRC